MFDWIMHNKGLFLTSYTEIGGNHQHAVELQTQHNHFAMNCMVRYCLCVTVLQAIQSQTIIITVIQANISHSNTSTSVSPFPVSPSGSA